MGTLYNARISEGVPLKSNRLNFYGATIDAYVMAVIQKPKKPNSALFWIGILVIIAGFYMGFDSIGSSGGIPTNLELAFFICGVSLFIGMVTIIYYVVLENKHSVFVEKETEVFVMEKGNNFPSKVSFIPLFVSCFLLFCSFIANWMLGDTESNFLFLVGILLLIYYLVLVIKRDTRVKALAEEM